MKIKETVERECCQTSTDLLKYNGTFGYGFKRLWFCVKCGQLWHYTRRAGEMDHGYEKVTDEDMKQ